MEWVEEKGFEPPACPVGPGPLPRASRWRELRRKLVDERGFEPPASSLRKQIVELDGAKPSKKE